MYSSDFRKLALRILKQLNSYRRAAAVCKVSTSTLHRWATRVPRESPPRARRKKLSEAAAHILKEFLQSQPVSTFREMSAHLSRHGFRAGYRAIRTALLGVRFSRKRTTKRFSSKSVANEASRDSFKESLRTALANKEKNLVVSLDECYFSEKTLPLYGYSPIGQPCVVRSPTATWKQRSLLLAVGSDGSKVSLISNGSITGEKFRDFIGNLPYAPGTVLLMDNASIHKGESLQSMRIKGYNPLFTPPYSPEFNPVENVFSVVKGSFRSTWPWVSGIEASIRTGIAEATPLTISNAFRHLEHVLYPGVSG